MPKVKIVRAAALVALLSFGLSPMVRVARAESRKAPVSPGSPETRRAPGGRKAVGRQNGKQAAASKGRSIAPVTASSSSSSPSRSTRASRNHSHKASRHGASASRAKGAQKKPRASKVFSARKSPKAPRKLLHQNAQGEVVIDRVELVGMPVAGPSKEAFNYPPAPCEGADVVIEARMHEGDVDAPEGDAIAQAAELAQLRGESEGEGSEASMEEAAGPPASGARASLARVARKVGSFFRPKSAQSEVKPQDVDLTSLLSESFQIPVEGVDPARLRDSFLSSRGRHAKHLAIDIGAPKGTPILATTDGEITRISKERRGGKAIYQKDSTGQYLLFYCHLSRYAEDLEVGQKVKKGDVIGYVGSTGHVIGGSHLHFSITRVPDDGDSFKKGLAINPYLLFLAGVP